MGWGGEAVCPWPDSLQRPRPAPLYPRQHQHPHRGMDRSSRPECGTGETARNVPGPVAENILASFLASTAPGSHPGEGPTPGRDLP